MIKSIALLALVGCQGIYAISFSYTCQSTPTAIPIGFGSTQIACPGANPGVGNAINSATLTIVGDYFGGGLVGTNIVRFGTAFPSTGPNMAIGGPSSSVMANMLVSLGTGPVSGINPINFNVASQVTQGNVAFAGAFASVTYDYSPFTSSQSNPLLPNLDPGNPGFFTFTNVNSGGWFDPPFTSGYDYAGTDGTLFTSLNLPTGFGSFNIYVGNGFGTLLGSFLSGANVDFLSLVGSAQSTFRIAGINPPVDSADPLAFPLQVFFSTPTGSFTQTPLADVPEPATWIGMIAGLGLLWIKRRQAS